MSPENPGNLVASVTCLRGSESDANRWEPGKGRWLIDESADGRIDAGRQAADYRVHVIGPEAKPVPLTRPAARKSPRPGPNRARGWESTPRSAQLFR